MSETVKVTKSGHEYGVLHFLATDSTDLCTVTSVVLDLSSERINELLALGSIYVNQKRILKNIDILKGDHVRVHTKPRRYSYVEVSKLILFQNEDFIVVDKPSGIGVHASVDNYVENLLTYLEAYLQVPLFITHRLDVATRGLLVIAKTKEFQREFNKYLTEDKVQKMYTAKVLAENKLSVGQIIHYMEPSPRAPKSVSTVSKEGWLKCVLEILECSEVVEGVCSLKIRLITGRTHQIRAQLANLGFPVLGDWQYGSVVRFSNEERIELESVELRFGSYFFSSLVKWR